MNRFDELRKELAEIITHSDIPTDPAHSISTREWLLKLYPDASEELQIAALGHDIDRAVPPRTHQLENETYDDFKQRHSDRSAELIAPLMRKHGYGEESIANVVHYVRRHEFGGDTETDFLTDADSISYFQDNIGMYIGKYGPEKTKAKISFMYERASKRAQDIISKIEFAPQNAALLKEALAEINQ